MRIKRETSPIDVDGPNHGNNPLTIGSPHSVGTVTIANIHSRQRNTLQGLGTPLSLLHLLEKALGFFDLRDASQFTRPSSGDMDPPKIRLLFSAQRTHKKTRGTKAETKPGGLRAKKILFHCDVYGQHACCGPPVWPAKTGWQFASLPGEKASSSGEMPSLTARNPEMSGNAYKQRFGFVFGGYPNLTCQPKLPELLPPQKNMFDSGS